MDMRKNIIDSLLGKSVHVEIDRPLGHIHKGTAYPINYGYIPGVLAGDGEEQDAYILGVNEPLSSFDGWVVGAVCRKNDVEDKLVVAPKGMTFHQGQIAEAVHFQEQFFDTYVISLLRKSCGVLPWTEEDGKRKYLIVFEQFSQCWSLPKGHMEAGETEEHTAQRELLEETGLTAQLDTSSHAVIEYPISPVARKQVVFFPGRVNGTPSVRPGEIQRFKWVSEEELDHYLFPDTVIACRKLIAHINSGD
jgi:8-oxo-dGTP pyrophosphatase MutT (NUDIX family)